MFPFSEVAAHYAFNYALNDYGTDTAEGFSMWAGLKFPHFDEVEDATTNFAQLFEDWCETLDERPYLLMRVA